MKTPSLSRTPLRYRLAHAVWRRFPRTLRNGVLHGVLPLVSPRKDTAPSADPLPIAVGGLLTTPSGMGYSARLCLAALFELGLLPQSLNLSHAFNVHHPALPEPVLPRLSSEDEGGSLLLHINGPYVPYVLSVMGQRQLRGRRLIGFWHWELPRLPPRWATGAKSLHQIWAPTSFVAESVRRIADCPVHVVPHPLQVSRHVFANRRQLGWRDDTFVTLVIANVASGFFRKNVLGAISAFRRAFGTNAKRRLVIKLSEAEHYPAARRLLTEAVGGSANIEIIEHTLPRNVVDTMLASADAILSLHRAEGFGLVPAEAMRLGRPVIATAWSGNLDFMDEQSAALVRHRLVPVDDPQRLYDLRGERWAEPDLDHAVEWLRRLANDPDLCRQIGEAAQRKAEACFGLDAYARAVSRALPALGPLLKPPPAVEPPAPTARQA